MQENTSLKMIGKVIIVTLMYIRSINMKEDSAVRSLENRLINITFKLKFIRS